MESPTFIQFSYYVAFFIGGHERFSKLINFKLKEKRKVIMQMSAHSKQSSLKFIN